MMSEAKYKRHAYPGIFFLSLEVNHNIELISISIVKQLKGGHRILFTEQIINGSV